MGITASSTKVVFFPHKVTDNNPYLNQLSAALSDMGYDFEPLSYRIFFLSRVLNSRKKVILHIHWLHSFFIKSSLIKSLLGLLVFCSQLLILKILGVGIVWTAHNLRNHEGKFPNLDHFGTKIVSRLSDLIIAHSDTAAKEVIEYLNIQNREKVVPIPHLNYIDSYPNSMGRDESRKILNIPKEDTVLLFLGLIRPYKGVDDLIDAFKSLSVENTSLIIAGKIRDDDSDYRSTLEGKATGNNNIKLIPEYVPDDQLQVYLRACDIVVFPYKKILTSGSILLAMSFGKPCIAPKMGCIQDVLDAKGAFLYDPQSTEGLLNAIKSAVKDVELLDQMGKHNYDLSVKYSPQAVSSLTSTAYISAMSKKR